MCACSIRRREARVLECVPPRFRDARLADFPGELQESLQRWIEAPGDGLFLSGAPGTGKSHLAAALLLRWRQSGRPGLWRAAAEFYRLLRETYREGGTAESSILQEHVEAGLLVLDDVGATGLSDHERRATLELLDARLNALRPTIVTSNLTVAEIGERMDDRLGSRLASLRAFALRGRDRRVAPRAED